MKPIVGAYVAVVAIGAGLVDVGQDGTAARVVLAQGPPPQGRLAPTFEVDPAWPKLPSQWVLGLVSGINVDADGHVWVLHRPRTVKPEQKGMAAPPVLEFDEAGNFVQGWGGPGEGYEWFGTEHGISVDSRGFVWLGGSGDKDDHILKFTKTGTFVLQIGRSGQSQGNTDTKNLHSAADVFLHAKTDEIFVADGYGNRRVIVFDADTGAFKRMWGAFGNVPTDGEPPPQIAQGPGAPQFNNVHAVRVSNDGLVYVSDRDNQRVQVFRLDGTYVTQVFINRGTLPPSTATGTAVGRPLKEVEDELLQDPSDASRTAFSPDPEQRFLYLIDRRHQKVLILERTSLEVIGSVGSGVGREPGKFYILHDIAVDAKGNLYTAEVNNNGNRRAQKFAYKGLARAPSP